MIEIKQMLERQKIKSKELREEYLDHFCSKLECLIQDGIPKEKALFAIHNEIAHYDFKNANKQYFKLHYQKPLLMTSALFIVFATLFFIPDGDNAIRVTAECIEDNEYVGLLVSSEDPPSMNPIAITNNKVYSGFGMRMHPFQKVKRFHGGIDISASTGTPIVAPSNGTVTKAGYHKKKGNWIEIQHDDIYYTRYYHLSKIDVDINQKITKGTKIGVVGSSGQSMGPHLHYEVIKNGKNVDPEPYLQV